MAAGFSSRSQKFNTINRNNLDESEDGKKEILILSLPNKSKSWNDEIAIEFRLSSVNVDEEDIALVNFIESIQKQSDKEIFPKK